MSNFFKFSIAIVGLSFIGILNAEDTLPVSTEQKQPETKTISSPRTHAAKNLAAAVETLKSAKNELTNAIEQAKQKNTVVDTKTLETMTEFIRLQEKIEEESKKHYKAERTLWIAGAVAAATLILVELIAWKKTSNLAKKQTDFAKQQELEIKEFKLQDAEIKELFPGIAEALGKLPEAKQEGSKVAKLIEKFEPKPQSKVAKS